MLESEFQSPSCLEFSGFTMGHIPSVSTGLFQNNVVSSPLPSACGFSQWKLKTKNKFSMLLKLTDGLSFSYHVAHSMVPMISTQCTALSTHTCTLDPQCESWGQYRAPWRNCEKKKSNYSFYVITITTTIINSAVQLGHMGVRAGDRLGHNEEDCKNDADWSRSTSLSLLSLQRCTAFPPSSSALSFVHRALADLLGESLTGGTASSSLFSTIPSTGKQAMKSQIYVQGTVIVLVSHLFVFVHNDVSKLRLSPSHNVAKQK